MNFTYSKKLTSCILKRIMLFIKYVLVKPETSNYLIHKDTTITDVYTVYKETCLNLIDTTKELEKSKSDFNILHQVIEYLIKI